jgi:hypothetical protein
MNNYTFKSTYVSIHFTEVQTDKVDFIESSTSELRFVKHLLSWYGPLENNYTPHAIFFTASRSKMRALSNDKNQMMHSFDFDKYDYIIILVDGVIPAYRIFNMFSHDSSQDPVVPLTIVDKWYCEDYVEFCKIQAEIKEYTK